MRRWRFAWAWTIGITLTLGLLGCAGNPPPDLCPKPPPPGEPTIVWRGDDQVELSWDDMPVTVCEGEDVQARILQRQVVLKLPEARTPVSLDSFLGFDRGDTVEADVSFYDDQNRVLYRRSLHLEGGVPECYDAFEPRPSLSVLPTTRITMVVTCRANGPNEVTGALSARCHLLGAVIFDQGASPPPPEACVPPGEPPEPWGAPVPASTRPPKMGDALQAAKIVVGDRCGHPFTETLALLAEALKDAGHCADGPWGKAAGQGDAVAIRAPDLWHGDPLYEEFHAVRSEDGCYTLGGRYKNAWPYEGDSPGDCVNPSLPDRDRYIALHCPGDDPTRKWCDATAKVKRNCEYCAEIGLPCMPSPPPPACTPRCDCPLRTEGHLQREACEQEFYGPVPIWSSDGDVQMNPNGNPARARTRTGTWIKVCTADGICAQVGP